MSYSAEVSRKSSGMNLVLPTLGEILDRIRDYDNSFPGETISIKIERLDSRTAVREALSESKAADHQALVNTAVGLKEQGMSERAISENMGVPRSTVRLLLRDPADTETWGKRDSH